MRLKLWLALLTRTARATWATLQLLCDLQVLYMSMCVQVANCVIRKADHLCSKFTTPTRRIRNAMKVLERSVVDAGSLRVRVMK